MGDARVESCRDCPRFRKRRTQSGLGAIAELYEGPLYEYICDKAGRYIMPEDGVKPPPRWCPLRPRESEAGAEAVESLPGD